MCTLDEEIVPLKRHNPAASVEEQLLQVTPTNT